MILSYSARIIDGVLAAAAAEEEEEEEEDLEMGDCESGLERLRGVRLCDGGRGW